jgi:hypothetical protein
MESLSKKTAKKLRARQRRTASQITANNHEEIPSSPQLSAYPMAGIEDARQEAANYLQRHTAHMQTTVPEQTHINPTSCVHGVGTALADLTVKKLDARLLEMEQDWALTRSEPFPEGILSTMEDLRQRLLEREAEATQTAAFTDSVSTVLENSPTLINPTTTTAALPHVDPNPAIYTVDPEDYTLDEVDEVIRRIQKRSEKEGVPFPEERRIHFEAMKLAIVARDATVPTQTTTDPTTAITLSVSESDAAAPAPTPTPVPTSAPAPTFATYPNTAATTTATTVVKAAIVEQHDTEQRDLEKEVERVEKGGETAGGDPEEETSRGKNDERKQSGEGRTEENRENSEEVEEEGEEKKREEKEVRTQTVGDSVPRQQSTPTMEVI